MRVLALVPYPLGQVPGQRYRIEQWAPYLREARIEVHFSSFAHEALASVLYLRGRHAIKALRMIGAWVRSLSSVRRAAGFDALYLYREASLIGPALLERLARRRNPRLMYDFDDAIWLPYVSPRNRYLSYLKVPGKTAAICRMAAAVTVGNDTLAQYARRYNRAVTVVPSTVSLREYRPRSRSRPDGPPVVGWTGSHSSAQYLRLVEGALQTLARRRAFRFLVIGLDGYRLEGVDVECRAWRAATEVEDLWSMDVGIMPLSDDPWSSAKCAMKAIQYMGVGLPAVVSPIGTNREVVTDGVSGFHAVTEEDWVRVLDRIMSDADLRRRIGGEGRRRVEAWYSAEVQAPRVAELLMDLVA